MKKKFNLLIVLFLTVLILPLEHMPQEVATVFHQIHL